MTGETGDYIVVGGGSAGAVIAARLSENPAIRVTLLEAGAEPWEPVLQIPAGMAKLIGHRKYDWAYEQEPDHSIGERQCGWPAGKVLGGGSGINGQVHIRGTRRDYDNWVRLGAEGWGYADCLPYFLKSDNTADLQMAIAGKTVRCQFLPFGTHPLCQTFLAACAEMGLPTLTDYADGEMKGAFQTVATQRNGWRCSTEKAYLRPARSRPNLRIVTNAEVTRILFENGCARGVEARVKGQSRTFHVSAEVIVSAGAIGSPALLMRSGIGDPEELSAHGVSLVAALPNVGLGLMEHFAISISKYVSAGTYNSQTTNTRVLRNLVDFLLFQKGMMSAPANQAMALMKTRQELEDPDLLVSFCPYAMEFETPSASGPRFRSRDAITIVANICRPESRGRVRLSRTHRNGLKIQHAFLGDDRDLQTLIRAGGLLQRLFETDALNSIVVGNHWPVAIPVTESDWADYIRTYGFPCYHPAGTCRMGSDSAAVLKPDLAVRVSGLRVADASIMPALVSANTNAAAIMIGERAADVIKQSATPRVAPKLEGVA